MQQPTVGRIVNYFPNKEDFEAASGSPETQKHLPMIISQVDGNTVTGTVFSNNPSSGPLKRFNVPHQSEASDDYVSYWDWPERK
jgi:hypothetical protein